MNFRTALVFLVMLIAGACSLSSEKITISGTVWSSTGEELYIELPPVHYKYAPKRRISIHPDAKGSFSVPFTPEEDDSIAWFYHGDFSTPVLLKEGTALRLTQSVEAPEQFDIQGYTQDWHSLLNAFNLEDRRLINMIRNERQAFRDGNIEQTLMLYRTRIHLAKAHLAETPYRSFIHKAAGEYLVVRLKAVELLYAKDQVAAQKERESVLAEAEKLGFFSFHALKAQRAGIRDFTDAWANTFGVKDSLERALGQKLMAYDVKRLGYSRMNAAREQVMNLITDPQARAWSEMHLVAERLGEAPFAEAEPSFLAYKKSYEAFTEYTAVLEQLYTDIKKVSPGSVAPAFAFADSSGNMISLEHYRGKYVLLDFWAQWCSPCLEEFPHMRRLYTEFNRNTFEIVAISLDADKDVWLQSVRAHKNPWIQVWGGKEFENELFKTYRGGGIPFYVLIDPDGKVLRYNDVRPSFNLEAVLNAALGHDYAGMMKH
jgi:thiol-disulfide isomerase/thioredoxin